jgi:hypothetical protein
MDDHHMSDITKLKEKNTPTIHKRKGPTLVIGERGIF